MKSALISLMAVLDPTWSFSPAADGDPSLPLPMDGAWQRAIREAAQSAPRLRRALTRWEQAPDDPAAALDLQMWFTTTAPRAMLPLLSTLPAPHRDGLVARLIACSAAARLDGATQQCTRLVELVADARVVAAERVLAWALAELGRAHGTRSDLLRSTEALSECITLTRELQMPALEAIALANLGMLYGQENAPEPYARYTREALAVSRRIEDAQGVAHCLCNLGGALSASGALDEAMACYTEALPLAEVGGFRYIEALIYAGVGGVHYERGDGAAGRAGYARSNAMLAEMGMAFQGTRHHLLEAAYLMKAGDAEAAETCARAARALAHDHALCLLEAKAEEALADALVAQGRLPDAVEAFRACVRLQGTNLEKNLQESQEAAHHAHRALVALKQGQAERSRSAALEAQQTELRAALAAREALQAELERASRTDPLTGLANRRALDERLAFLLGQARRAYRPLALLLIDADHFKRVNDRFGHAAGDAVLVELARRIGAKRTTDLAARFGGEEFCLLLPDTDRPGAAVVAEALRAAVVATPIETVAGTVRVTVSVGVAVSTPETIDADMLLGAADQALYAAKRGGRDQIALAPAGPGESAAPAAGR